MVGTKILQIDWKTIPLNHLWNRTNLLVHFGVMITSQTYDVGVEITSFAPQYENIQTLLLLSTETSRKSSQKSFTVDFQLELLQELSQEFFQRFLQNFLQGFILKEFVVGFPPEILAVISPGISASNLSGIFAGVSPWILSKIPPRILIRIPSDIRVKN